MAVIHLSEGTFDKTVSQGVVLVDFWAGWCGPCKMLGPTIEELAGAYEGRALVCKVDVDAEGGLASRFGVMSIPTVLFFQDGALKETLVGLQPKEAYSQKLDALLAGQSAGL